MFEPTVAARYLNYEVELRTRIPALPGSKMPAEAAGTVDGNRRIICLSTQFSHEVRRFTLAHEIGHIVLQHPVLTGPLHRDRPLFDFTHSRSPIEADADYFGACLLVPKRILVDEFAKRFGLANPLPATETVAYHLGKTSFELSRDPRPRRAFATAVASATKFDRLRFPSLSSHFAVSVGAMAIRLEELGLIEA